MIYKSVAKKSEFIDAADSRIHSVIRNICEYGVSCFWRARTMNSAARAEYRFEPIKQ